MDESAVTLSINKEYITTQDYYDVTTLRKRATAVDSYYDDYYRYIGDMIRDWGPVALFPFGIIGNTFAFIVFSRPRMKSSITAFFFRLLALFDTLHLIIEVLPKGLETLTGVDMTRVVNWWCKTRYFFAYLTRDVAVWIIVLVTIERLLAVTIPHKAKIIVTKRSAAYSMVAMFLVLLALTLPVAWIIELGTLYSSSSGSKSIQKFAEESWPWIDFWIYSGAPFIIMLTSNAAIIFTVIVSNIRRRLTVAHNSQTGGLESQTLNMTAMLVCVSLAFIILTAPTCSYWLGTRASNSSYTGKTRLWFSVSKFLAYLNHAINFEIYCLSGRKFREELLLMCRCYRSSHTTSSSGKATNLSTVAYSNNDGNSSIT